MPFHENVLNTHRMSLNICTLSIFSYLLCFIFSLLLLPRHINYKNVNPSYHYFFLVLNLFYLSGLTLTSSGSIFLVLFWKIYTFEMNQCRTRQTVTCLQSICWILIQHSLQFSLR